MSCPYCGCKVTYQYNDSEYLERCASCGKVFDIEMADDDEDDYDPRTTEEIFEDVERMVMEAIRFQTTK